MKQTKQTPENCDCCQGTTVLTPASLFNRPGLNAIAYRVGTHGSFLQTMKARLSSSRFPKLAGLTTRESNDAAIALLDAWAVVADVLTFYQERIAAEGYLRTATERRSILELARLVGYRLRPGLSASVYLAYTLEPTQETTAIEPGNKAQSLPGPNETPQVFETSEKLIAHSSLNLLKPRLTRPTFFLPGTDMRNTRVVIKGLSANVRVNDALLLRFEPLNPGQPGESNTIKDSYALYRANEIILEPQLDRTTIDLRLQGPPPVFPKGPSTSTPGVRDSIKAIADKYLNYEAFRLSERSKMVQRVREGIDSLKAEAEAASTDEAMPSDSVQTLLSKLIDEYAFASSRGYNNIIAWLDELIEDLGKIKSSTDRMGGRNLPDDKSSSELPSFVDLFKPFKEPQSLQPRSEAQLGRQVGQILSGRSDFVAQVYAALQPKAAPFVKSVLANASPVEATTQSPKTEGVLGLGDVYALRLRASLAGRNLPPILREANNGNQVTVTSPPTLGDYVAALSDAGFPLTPAGDLTFVALDAQYDQIRPQSKIAIERPVVATDSNNNTGFRITIHSVTNAQTALLTFFDAPFTFTVLTLDTPWLTEDEIGSGSRSRAIIRSTAVFAQGEKLTQTDVDITDDLSFEEPSTDPVIELDGLYTSLDPGRWVIISGERVVIEKRAVPDRQPGSTETIPRPINPRQVPGAPINTGVQVSELVMVSSVTHEAKTLLNGAPVGVKGEKLHTFIRPAQAPAYRYRRNTVKIYGNVVRATHGETRNEVLGSGDGRQALQSFTLRQPPLTYLPASTPSGTESTLEVRVNDIRWRESPNLFELDKNDRRYITKTDDDGKTTVIFGNGERGARLPTGVENVKAVYRSGIGKGGNVKAEQVKLPLTKPLGVKGVINPLPASGGADKETLFQARRNAPISVLALDRLVSVQDYADFARTYAGIAKASATRLSDGARELVHVTIAGAGDIPIDLTSELYRNLVAALRRFGDPLLPLELEIFERVLLVVNAKVSLHPDYLWDSVKPKIYTVMFEEFGFENRELGQDVTQSEVVRAIQSVPGVDFVDLDLLDSVNEKKLTDPVFGEKLKLKKRVNAELARLSDNEEEILPAQLVYLSPDAKDTLILEERNERYQ